MRRTNILRLASPGNYFALDWGCCRQYFVLVRIDYSFIQLTAMSRRTSTLNVKSGLPSSGWIRFVWRIAAASRLPKFDS
jgi:hypothetical protein